MDNRPYTYKYFQPKEYQFSLDSIAMPFQVADYIQAGKITFAKATKDLFVLDLCAGCGVVGFEIFFHLKSIRHFDFVEVQSSYQSYFEQNKEMILNIEKSKDQNAEIHFNFKLMNYENLIGDLSCKNKYDLIVSNPPYFVKSQGTQSVNELKNRSRFFMDSSFAKLMETISFVLAEGGHAFVLVSNLSSHKIDLIEDARIQCEKLMIHIEIIDTVRGTNLVHIFKKKL